MRPAPSGAQSQDTFSADFRCRWCIPKQHCLRPTVERLAGMACRQQACPDGPAGFRNCQESGSGNQKQEASVYLYAGNRRTHPG